MSLYRLLRDLGVQVKNSTSSARKRQLWSMLWRIRTTGNLQPFKQTLQLLNTRALAHIAELHYSVAVPHRLSRADLITALRQRWKLKRLPGVSFPQPPPEPSWKLFDASTFWKNEGDPSESESESDSESESAQAAEVATSQVAVIDVHMFNHEYDLALRDLDSLMAEDSPVDDEPTIEVAVDAEVQPPLVLSRISQEKPPPNGEYPIFDEQYRVQATLTSTYYPIFDHERNTQEWLEVLD